MLRAIYIVLRMCVCIDSDSYVGGSVDTGRASHAGQVKG
jgi:hypothetical protein